MASLVATLGSGVKNVQRGVVTPGTGVNTGTVTISSVNTAKAFVLSVGYIINSGADLSVCVELTNATTLTWNSAGGPSGTNSRFAWQVVEYY